MLCVKVLTDIRRYAALAGLCVLPSRHKAVIVKPRAVHISSAQNCARIRLLHDSVCTLHRPYTHFTVFPGGGLASSDWPGLPQHRFQCIAGRRHVCNYGFDRSDLRLIAQPVETMSSATSRLMALVGPAC